MKWLGILIAILIVFFGLGYYVSSLRGTGNVSSITTNNSTDIIPSDTSTPSELGNKISEQIIVLTANGFEPQSITVKAGTKVIWENKSGNVATVNSALHPTHMVYPLLNLGEFQDRQQLSLIFDKAGAYKYHNHLNPGQTGEVVVQ